MTSTTIQIPISVAVLTEVIRALSASEKRMLKQLLDAEVAALEQTPQIIDADYPLRGLPLVITEDFDAPMPELWEALSQ